MALLTIHLQQLKFFAHHGLYEEEKIIGNQFELNVTIQHLPINKAIVSIHQSINYADVFELIQQRMQIPTPLLETVAQEICTSILQHFPQAHSVTLAITKTNPPIAQFNGSVGITYTMHQSEL